LAFIIIISYSGLLLLDVIIIVAADVDWLFVCLFFVVVGWL